MVNYQQGKIYKLASLVSDKIYVGSTCQKLCVRYAAHKRDLKIAPDRLVYKHINKIGWNNYSIILIENFPCNNREELEKQERYYIELLHSELNYNIPTRTQKEYLENNKELSREIKKEWYENNKERILNKKKKNYEIDKKTILNRIKIYNDTHKQQISEHQKQYREQNKEKICFKKSIWYLKQKFKKLIIDFNDISKEHDDLINKFNLLH